MPCKIFHSFSFPTPQGTWLGFSDNEEPGVLPGNPGDRGRCVLLDNWKHYSSLTTNPRQPRLDAPTVPSGPLSLPVSLWVEGLAPHSPELELHKFLPLLIPDNEFTKST